MKYVYIREKTYLPLISQQFLEKLNEKEFQLIVVKEKDILQLQITYFPECSLDEIFPPNLIYMTDTDVFKPKENE